jgi:hypothetical protein
MVLADVPRADRCRCREGVRPTAKATGTAIGKPLAKAAAGTPAPATEDASAVDRFKRWLRQ